MTDLQILTLALTLLGIFAGSWFNSSRIGDLNKRIDDTRDVLRAEMNLQFERINNKIDSQFERMNNKIDALLKSLADLEGRVTAVENRK